MKQHSYEIFRVTWRGIEIEITYEKNWLVMEGYSPCHLTICSVVPHRAELPITETGYKSHFTDPAFIDQAGGAVAYVIAELDAAAKSRKWITAEADSRQLALF